MRLDCPKCGAKGDSRNTKTPMWRCSPAPRNGGCGYEWDDPDFNDPNARYKLWLQQNAEAPNRRRMQEKAQRGEEEAQRMQEEAQCQSNQTNDMPPPTPEPTPFSETVKVNAKGCGGMIGAVILFLFFMQLLWMALYGLDLLT